MNASKAYTKVESLILEKECLIEENQQFVRTNKGNQKMKEQVEQAKIVNLKLREDLKMLYPIRNAFYY